MKTNDTYDGSTKTEGTHQMAIKSISAAQRKELLSLDNGMAERIKEIMEQQGVLDRDLARALDVADRTIYNWKTTGQVSRKLLPLLGHYLGCSVEWLVTGKTTEFLKPRPSDDNVVEFNREAGFEGTNMPLIDRFLPAISTAEIGMGRDAVRQIISEFSKNHGDRLGISVAFFNPNVPGIPKFAQQIILPEFCEDMPLGTMVGFADDISPIPGDFIVGRNNGKFVAGFFFPVGEHIASSNRADSYLNLDNFEVCRRKIKKTVMDVQCSHDTFELIGVCTYKAEWLSPSLLEEQTNLRSRMKTAFESRRLDD